MPNGEAGGIVIKGPSVSLQYNERDYAHDPNDPHTLRNRNQTITQILIVGPNGTEYDSGDHPEGLMFSIYVMCR
jgi:hypothetical protein